MVQKFSDWFIEGRRVGGGGGPLTFPVIGFPSQPDPYYTESIHSNPSNFNRSLCIYNYITACTAYTVKKVSGFPSPDDGMSLTKHSLAGNNSSRLGTEKLVTFFYSVSQMYGGHNKQNLKKIIDLLARLLSLLLLKRDSPATYFRVAYIEQVSGKIISVEMNVKRS